MAAVGETVAVRVTLVPVATLDAEVVRAVVVAVVELLLLELLLPHPARMAVQAESKRIAARRRKANEGAMSHRFGWDWRGPEMCMGAFL